MFWNGIWISAGKPLNLLGLILDSKLTFDKHISQKMSIVRKAIGIIKYMSSYAPTKTLDQIYKIFVRPHMDYCDIIYHLPVQRAHLTALLT